VRVERKPVLDERQWKKFFDHTGRLAISATEVKEAVFHGVVPRYDGIDGRVWILRCVRRCGSFYWDCILGVLLVMKGKRFDGVNGMNMFD
jgi:hypothetical protein